MEYIKEAMQLLEKVEKDEAGKISEAAEIFHEQLNKGGIIHVFGCGHSHMIAEEVFYRAGGLVPVHPILHEPLMLHEGALKSSELEKKEGYAQQFLGKEDFRKEDVLVIVSTSGKNPVPIDVALFAKEKGMKVVTISSHIYAETMESRHHTGKFLHEAGDIAIDNKIPIGDALVSHENIDERFAPGSTITSTAIMQSIVSEAVKLFGDHGEDVPIFRSGNVSDASAYNKALIKRYEDRINF